MAIGCKELFGSDISLSTTGVAGPGKGEDGNDVGTVFYTIKVKNFEKTYSLHLPHLERNDFQYFVSQKVIQDLVTVLIEQF